VNRSPAALLDEVSAALVHDLPVRTRVSEATLLEEGEDGVWGSRARFPLGG
jgi:hypothetical protein